MAPRRCSASTSSRGGAKSTSQSVSTMETASFGLASTRGCAVDLVVVVDEDRVADGEAGVRSGASSPAPPWGWRCPGSPSSAGAASRSCPSTAWCTARARCHPPSAQGSASSSTAGHALGAKLSRRSPRSCFLCAASWTPRRARVIVARMFVSRPALASSDRCSRSLTSVFNARDPSARGGLWEAVSPAAARHFEAKISARRGGRDRARRSSSSTNTRGRRRPRSRRTFIPILELRSRVRRGAVLGGVREGPARRRGSSEVPVFKASRADGHGGREPCR